MAHRTFSAWLVGLALLCGTLGLTTEVRSEEWDELRQLAKDLQRQSMEMAEQGRGEEAAGLKEKAHRVMIEADELQARAEKRQPPEGRSAQEQDARLRNLRQLMVDLRRKEVAMRDQGAGEDDRAAIKEHIAALQTEMKELQGRMHKQLGDGDGPGQMREMVRLHRRLMLTRSAAESLKAAELPDLAHEAVQRADQFERKLDVVRKEMNERLQERWRSGPGSGMGPGFGPGPGPGFGPGPGPGAEFGGPPGGGREELRALREELGRLRDEIRQLRDQRSTTEDHSKDHPDVGNGPEGQ